MFKKMKLRKQIKRAKENISALEQKRSRSQAALVTALLNNETPKDEEVDYFNHFSELIDLERDRLKRLTEAYEAKAK